MNALLPCPFCGGASELEDHRTIWAVRCACGASVLGKRAPEPDGTECAAYWDDIRSTAITAWNRRAPVQAQGVSLSEREAFDTWVKSVKGAISFAEFTAWKAWQARAALAQAPQQAASERPTAAGAACRRGEDA